MKIGSQNIDYRNGTTDEKNRELTDVIKRFSTKFTSSPKKTLRQRFLRTSAQSSVNTDMEHAIQALFYQSQFADINSSVSEHLGLLEEGMARSLITHHPKLHHAIDVQFASENSFKVEMIFQTALYNQGFKVPKENAAISDKIGVEVKRTFTVTQSKGSDFAISDFVQSARAIAE